MPSHLDGRAVGEVFGFAGPDGAGLLEHHGGKRAAVAWGLEAPEFVDGWEPAVRIDYRLDDPRLRRAQQSLRPGIDVHDSHATYEMPVLVLRYRDQDLLVDGNHRVAGAFAREETTVKAVVVDAHTGFHLFDETIDPDTSESDEAEDVISLGEYLDRMGAPHAHVPHHLHGLVNGLADLEPALVSLWSDPVGASAACTDASERLRDWAWDNDVDATIRIHTGPTGEVRRPKGWVGDVGHVTVSVDGWTIDLTARQFWPDAPWPLIEPDDVYRARWGTTADRDPQVRGL